VCPFLRLGVEDLVEALLAVLDFGGHLLIPVRQAVQGSKFGVRGMGSNWIARSIGQRSRRAQTSYSLELVVPIITPRATSPDFFARSIFSFILHSSVHILAPDSWLNSDHEWLSGRHVRNIRFADTLLPSKWLRCRGVHVP
jgi:hypothetical protein